MAIQLTTVNQTVSALGVDILIHSPPKTGKTSLFSTCPNPLFISSEQGLRSLLADSPDGVGFAITNFAELKEVRMALKQQDFRDTYQTIFLDSLSDIADVCLSAHKQSGNKHGGAAYGSLNDDVLGEVREIRELPYHKVVIAQQARNNVDVGNGIKIDRYGPSMPGQGLTQKIGYPWDSIFALREVYDEHSKQHYRWIQTRSDTHYESGTRTSRELDAWEIPHIGNIISKMTGNGPIEGIRAVSVDEYQQRGVIAFTSPPSSPSDAVVAAEAQ